MKARKKDFFEELFDRGTFLQRRMVLLLSKTNGRWVSRQWISDSLGISKHTTVGVLNELQEKIENLNTSQFSFQLSKGKGVRLFIKRDADVYQLVTEIVKECSTVKLLEALITDEFENVRHYALKYFISESTVRRDLSKVQPLLDRYGIEISRESFQLIGEEYQIRMFLVIFFWSIYRGNSWPFPHIDEERVEQFVDHMLDSGFTVYPNIPYAYKKQLAYIFAEAIIRTRKGHILKMPQPLEDQITTNTLYSGFKEIMTSEHGVINTRDSEIPFFFLVWVSMSKTIDVFKEPLVDELMRQQAAQQTQIYAATELMVTRFQEEFFPIKDEDLWRFRSYILSAHFFAKYFKGFNTDMMGNTYKAIFKERYPQLIKKTRAFVERLYEESANPIFLELDFLLIPYLKNILFLADPCRYEVPISILVESDMPSLMTKNFIRQLSGYFNYLYNLSINDVFETTETNVDILLTTSTLKDMTSVYPEAQIVVVGKSLLMNDLERINEVLEQVATKKQDESN
ncbi:helix-turn-helix domain-containing protein [Enterococcus malodoratus]|uniref:helix-turn-helix domain-containing protein n=1 Tax=Enterococcus malodoratus TaxID=71451 RepID=UPI003FD3EBE4